MAAAVLLLAGLLVQDPAVPEDAAHAVLRKLGERAAGVRALSAEFVQNRRTPLMREPLKSSGTLHYRRDPEKLVFFFAEPRPTVVHLDRAMYRVYRPEEKRLEEFELGDSEGARWLFLAFNPKLEDLEKGFKISKGERREGAIDVLLEPTEAKVRTVLQRLTLRLKEEGPSVERVTYVDAEGGEVVFELSKLAIDPKLPPETFELRVPDGVRVIQHKR